MAILFMSTHAGDAEAYLPLLKGHLPDQDIRVWPDAVGDAADIEIAIIAVPEPGCWPGCPTSRPCCLVGRGRSLLGDPTFPRHIPLARRSTRCSAST